MGLLWPKHTGLRPVCLGVGLLKQPAYGRLGWVRTGLRPVLVKAYGLGSAFGLDFFELMVDKYFTLKLKMANNIDFSIKLGYFKLKLG